MKKILIWSGIILAVVLIGFFTLQSQGQKGPTYETTFAIQTDIKQIVSVTGQVKPAQDATLAFEQSGKVSEINVEVGDDVAMEQLLAAIDQANIRAQLSEAAARIQSDRASLSQLEAALATEQVLLTELKRGSRPEDVAISQTKVTNAEKAVIDAQTKLEKTQAKAQTDLANIYDDIQNVLRDALNKTEDAVYTKTNSMIPDADASLPKATFESRDENALRLAELYKLQLRGDIVNFETKITALGEEFQDLESALSDGIDLLQFVQSYLGALENALKKQQSLASATAESYKASVNTAKTNITTALTSITNKEQEILAQDAANSLSISNAQTELNNANYSLDVARRELTLKTAGATAEEIAAQEARIKQAEANVSSGRARIAQSQANYQSVEAQLKKTQLVSPIDGLVVKQDMELGEIVTAGTPYITLISKANYQIEANIPEVDIAKVKLEDIARVDLDAYGADVVFEVKVVKIDPAETIIDGVPTYKVTFEFTENDQRIKSGMTANIDIMAANKDNVVAVPGRTIFTKNGKKFVRKLVTKPDGSKEAQEIIVQTGLRGTGGNTEILSGVQAGDEIVVYIEE